MKKILFLINRLSGGGAEKVLIDTVNNLDSEKYDITVQTVLSGGCYVNSLAPYVKYKSMIRAKKPFFAKLMYKILIKCLPAKWTYNLKVKDNYDVEIAFLEGVPTKIISNSSNKKSKKISWLHTDLISYPVSAKTIGGEKKEKESYEKVDHIVCVSNSVKERLISKYALNAAKIKVLYNVLDDKNILEKSKEEVEVRLQQKPLLISVGRLCYEKGFDILLKVHKRLLDDGYNHSLVIVGEGNSRAELEKIINDNNLHGSATLVGFQSNPYKYISKADLFVCSSRAEGYSMVISEAAIIGVPVLSVDVSGAREPFDNPRCSIIVANDEEHLYEGLKSVLSSSVKLEELKRDVKERSTTLTTKSLIDKVESFFDSL